MKIEFLGQAGLYIETKNCRLLCDPWFSKTGAFLSTWHQFPPNEHINQEKLENSDYLYLSHMHYDHFDKEFLNGFPKDVKIIIADYVSKGFKKEIEHLGFSDITELRDWQKIALAEDFNVTLITDPCKYKEDSSIVIDAEGFSILNKNDCFLSNAYLTKIAENKIHLMFTQFSGAMWYPAAYKYEEAKKKEVSRVVREYLINNFIRFVNTVNPAFVIPSAGPPCFLDDDFFEFNFAENGIFPDQNDIRPYLDRNLASSKYNCMMPGDTVTLKDGQILFTNNNPYDFGKKEELLRDYQKRRLPYIYGFLDSLPEAPANMYDVFESYIKRIASKNEFITTSIRQLVEFNIEGKNGGTWQVDFRDPLPAVYDKPVGQAQYIFWIDVRILNLVLSGQIYWEDLFLSIRFKAKRDPDIYNWPLFALLRYGHDENLLRLVELNELRTRAPTTINIKDKNKLYKVQRFCPHLGEDLQNASIKDGVLVCSRHHWQFDLNQNGRCIFGGNKDLNIYGISELDDEEDSGSV